MTSRKTVMRLLAFAPAPLLESALQKDLPAVRARGCKLIRKPETGLIMARGRISGTGSPFNVGEVLVTRCAVSLTGGQTGYAWILGADSDHARDAALLDALWQDPECGPFLERELLPAMQKAVEEKRAARVKRAAGTRVNFFTMVRGED